ncbi:MAG: hypothetical protein ABI361_13130 [Nitrososphaera sp.]|jgi:DNA-binding IclR family transcriptional regulator
MHASLTEQSVKILQLVGRRPGMRISDIVLLTGVNLIELLKTLAQLEEGGAVTVALDSPTQNFLDYKVYLKPR